MGVPKTITIGSQVCNTYFDLTDMTNYVATRAGMETWTTSGDTAKQSRDIVTASRFADRLKWNGARINARPALAWPRSGVIDADGNTVSTSVIPDQVVWGVMELAYSLFVNPKLLMDTGQGTNSNIKLVKGGPAEVEFFRPVMGTRIPTASWDFLKEYINGAGTDAAPESFGTDGTSAFDDSDPNYDFGLNRP